MIVLPLTLRMRWTASKSKRSKRSSVKAVDVSKPASINFDWTYLNTRPEEPECRYSVNLEGMTQIVSQFFLWEAHRRAPMGDQLWQKTH